MIYVVKKVRDWKTHKMRNLNTFLLDRSDYNAYSGKIWGFVHGTNLDSFHDIIKSGKLTSSYNLRQEQTANGLNTTGKDRYHDGQYTVYFRFVTRKAGEELPNAIVNSTGGVGCSSGYYLFVPLGKIVEKNICFALAGGADGKTGINSFTDEAIINYINNYCNSTTDTNAIKQAILRLGKSRFESGLSAAGKKSSHNEIGFYNYIPLDCVEFIMTNQGVNSIINYTPDGEYSIRNNRWKLFRRNNFMCNPNPNFTTTVNQSALNAVYENFAKRIRDGAQKM